MSLIYCRSTGYREFNIRDMTSPVKFLAFVWYIDLSRDILEMIYELRSYPSILSCTDFLRENQGGEDRKQNIKVRTFKNRYK